MKLVSSTFVSAAALLVALSFSPVSAEPQHDEMPAGAPSGGSPSGDQGLALKSPSGGGAAHNPGSASENSNQIDQGNAPQSGKAGKGAKNAASEEGKVGEMNPGGDKGKSAESPPTSDKSKDANTGEDNDTKTGEAKDNKGGEAKDAKSGENTYRDKSKMGETGKDTNDADKSKVGEAGEGKGDHGNKNVRIDAQEVGKVRTYFTAHRPNVQRIERNRISVSVGINIPSDIVLYDLPPDVIVVRGTCPVKYFLWGEDLVLVDSCSREVVEIIGGIA